QVNRGMLYMVRLYSNSIGPGLDRGIWRAGRPCVPIGAPGHTGRLSQSLQLACAETARADTLWHGNFGRDHAGTCPVSRELVVHSACWRGRRATAMAANSTFPLSRRLPAGG